MSDTPKDHRAIGITRNASAVTVDHSKARLSVEIHHNLIAIVLDERIYEPGTTVRAVAKDAPVDCARFVLSTGFFNRVRFAKEPFRSSMQVRDPNGNLVFAYRNTRLGTGSNHKEFEAFKNVLATELAKFDLSRKYTSESIGLLKVFLSRVGLDLDLLQRQAQSPTSRGIVAELPR